VHHREAEVRFETHRRIKMCLRPEGRGCAPGPAGGAYIAPAYPLAGFRGGE